MSDSASERGPQPDPQRNAWEAYRQGFLLTPEQVAIVTWTGRRKPVTANAVRMRMARAEVDAINGRYRVEDVNRVYGLLAAAADDPGEAA